MDIGEEAECTISWFEPDSRNRDCLNACWDLNMASTILIESTKGLYMHEHKLVSCNDY